MTNRWQSLYSSSADTSHIVETLSASLHALGYTLYDPFTGALRPAYARTVKAFIAPPQSGWTRILLENPAPPALLMALSHLGLALSVRLDESDTALTAALQAALNGAVVEAKTALLPHLRESVTEAMLAEALSGGSVIVNTHPHPQAIPLDVLPEEMQAMAGDLNSKHIGKMFNKLMKGVSRRVSGDSDAALDLLRSGTAAWTSQQGQQIHALMRCLTIPDPYWRVPDFVTVRDAYQLHHRRQQHPTARLYPGDAETMNALPEALHYIPVYGGQSD